MSLKVKLSNRQQQVLWATVQHYVATAKPVGSEALVGEFNLNVSSATVRNAMGRLEKVGLLYQPHTSAGRVPSDSGYRIYVDELITPSDQVARQVDQLLMAQLNWQTASLEALLRDASQILSSLSGYITLITMPQTQSATLRHIQIVRLDRRRAMLLVVLDCYETQSVLMNLPEADQDNPKDGDLLDRELEILSNFLNHHLRGRSLAEVSTLNWTELGQKFESYADVLQTSLAEISRQSQVPVATQILISGVSEVMRRHPEFGELQQVQTILQFLEEEQDQLWSVIFDEPDSLGGSRVRIRIGSENPLKPISNCTLLSASYHRDTVAVGRVCVLGPTRMVYEDAIALVEATADYLSEAMSESA